MFNGVCLMSGCCKPPVAKVNVYGCIEKVCEYHKREYKQVFSEVAFKKGYVMEINVSSLRKEN